MKLSIPEFNIEFDEGFSPHKDIFHRKEFGDKLYNLIKNSDENLVLALDSKWGEGKSSFIKMWSSENKYKKIPPLETIYFDAFSNDYQQSPFLALASEIYELLEDKAKEKREEFKEKATQVFKTFSRGIIKAGIRIGTAGVLDGSILDRAESDISSLVSEQIDTVIASKFESSKADKLALCQFKQFLSHIASKYTTSNRIVFIIDELDRCRPDFALDLLENIKHLFSVPGITFLLVMNKQQLEESVKCRYGNGIDSITYLQKFIHVWLSLPRTSGQYQQDDGVIYLNSCLELMSDHKGVKNGSAVKTLASIVKHLRPSFRDIERILTYFAILENSGNNAFNEYCQDFMALICYLKVIHPQLLEMVLAKSASSENLLDVLKLSDSSHYNNDRTLDYLARQIKFDLSDENNRENMIKQNLIHGFYAGRYPSDVLSFFSRELANIESIG